MIPSFPEFKQIELSDRADVNRFVERYEPYSDFNFTSLWAWDTLHTRALSVLNDNLVVRFSDYETQEPFLSYLGNNKIDETITTLLAYAAENGYPSELRLVPEVSIRNGDLTPVADIFEDRDNFDYIYSVPELSQFVGKTYETKRHLTKRFTAVHPEARVEVLDLSDAKAQHYILRVVDDWRDLKLFKDRDVELKHELEAIHRLFKSAEDHNLLAVGLFHGGKMIAFSIDEYLKNSYVLCHFAKADSTRKGIYDFFMQNKAFNFANHGQTYMNYEQDLGIESLRMAKSSFRPKRFLKKYIVRSYRGREWLCSPKDRQIPRRL